jgi:hypothetical protein
MAHCVCGLVHQGMLFGLDDLDLLISPIDLARPRIDLWCHLATIRLWASTSAGWTVSQSVPLCSTATKLPRKDRFETPVFDTPKIGG